jgi:hypothetical protein
MRDRFEIPAIAGGSVRMMMSLIVWPAQRTGTPGRSCAKDSRAANVSSATARME